MDAMRAYATLGIAASASPTDLRSAYRAQLQRYHPDTGAGNLGALQSVTAAYHELRSHQTEPAAPPPSTRVQPAAPGHVRRWPSEQAPVGSLVDLYA